MMRLMILLLAASLLLAARQPDVEVTAMKLRRDNGLILVDTTVKNVGTKPLRGLTLVYRFYSIQHEVMSTQRITVDEPELASQEESEVHGQVVAPPKSITVDCSATTTGGKTLEMANAGPFTIEE